MKKLKIAIISIVFLLETIIVGNVLAAEELPTAEVTLQVDETTILPENNEISIKINLGTMKNVPEDTILGLQALMDYDTNIIESVTFEKADKWSQPKYSSSTKIILIDGTEPSVQNTNIAIIKFNLKEDLKEDVQTKIKLSDIILASADDIQIECEDSEITLDIKRQSEEQEEDKKDENQDVNSNDDNNDTNQPSQEQNKQEEQIDNTVAKSKLPQTGIKQIIIVIILLTIVMAIFCIIRYKTILK